MKKDQTLILDGDTVKKLIDMKDALKVVEKAFKLFGQGKAQMPPKIYIPLPQYNGDFRAMPAYLDGFKGCSLKWVNAHPNNKSIPAVMAVLILNNPKNGFPLCVMGATYATALRTGAAGGIAAKYLARKDSRKVALVGCGAQAKTQLLAINEVFKIKEINLYDLSHSSALKFKREMRGTEGVKWDILNTVRDCVKDCDIIVTTTPSRRPIIKLNWLKKDVHINAIGADAQGKQELDSAIFKKAKIIVDAIEQARHSGEVNVHLRRKVISLKDIYADIGEIVSGRKKGRTKKDGITIFDSTGLAIQDVAIANLIYDCAVKSRAGKWIKMI